jgi:hypothetical protein
VRSAFSPSAIFINCDLLSTAQGLQYTPVSAADENFLRLPLGLSWPSEKLVYSRLITYRGLYRIASFTHGREANAQKVFPPHLYHRYGLYYLWINPPLYHI